MQSIIFDYLNNYSSFQLFGLSHWIAIFLFFFMVIFLPWFSKTHLEVRHQNLIGNILITLVFINYPIWVVLEFIAGTFDFKLHLPLHLCRFANLLLPIALFWKNDKIFQILYFWGMSAIFQAIFTPDIIHDFPHFHYFRYFFAHQLMVISIIYYVVVFKMKPTIHGLKNAFLALNIFLLVAFISNKFLGSNYFWIMDKPPAGSILDFMGPWPWYIFVAELVALLHFYLAFIVYKFLDYNFGLIKK